MQARKVQLVDLKKKAVQRSERRDKYVALVNGLVQHMGRDYRGQDVQLWLKVPAHVRGGYRYVYLGFWRYGIACHWQWDGAPSDNTAMAVYDVAVA